MPTSKQVKLAKQVIASQIKIAATSLKQMRAAVKADDLPTAVAAARALSAANDAADKAAAEAGVEITDAQLKALGYVEEEGGTWGLDIPMPVIKVIVAEDKAKGLFPWLKEGK